MKRTPYILLVGLVIVLAGATLYFWGAPYIAEVTPADGAQDVPASEALQITFSRRMLEESVQSRLSIDPPLEGTFAWEGTSLIFWPSQPWSGSVSVRLQAGAQAAGWLALSMRQGVEWSFTARSPRLAYLYPADGPADIYLLDMKSGEIQRLTQGGGSVLDYSVSRTGNAIYYSASLGSNGSQISRLELASGESVAVITCEQALCRGVQVSPDSKLLTYEQIPLPAPGQSNLAQVWLQALSSAGTAEGAPRLASPPEQRSEQPAWSPQGQLAYYNFDESAFTFLDPGTGSSQQTPSVSGIGGAWNHDGSGYMYVEQIYDAISPSPVITGLISLPSSHLMLYNLAGKHVQDLTQFNYFEDSTPAFSSDGAWLVFARKYLDLQRWSPGRQLWIMKPDGSQARALTQEPGFNHYGFAWHPDNQRLAYVRFNEDLLTEPPEIWLITSITSRGNAQRLISGGYAPAWIP